MTQAELYNAWQRYMHRSDLSADMDLTYKLAVEMVTERLMHAGMTAPQIQDEHHSSFLHAGLCYLHELAQDDEGRSRELRAFEDAIQRWHVKYSIDSGPKMMSRPYIGEDHAT
jgi:hypothetical protein